MKASVSDATPLVRNDPGQLLTQELTWTFDANLPVVDQPMLLADGRFVFRVRGNATLGSVVENSTNFFDWMGVSTNSLPGGQTWCTNLITDKDLVRYFRARSP